MTSQTTLRQKFFLIAFGIIFSLVILELVLRLGGVLFTFLQEKHNRAAFTQKEFRILCIGESTTALGGENSYPSQLEAILNERQTDVRFKVINKGLVSKTTSDILSRLPQYLQKYQPHLVVAMMGVNDAGILDVPKDKQPWLPGWVNDLRIYHFLVLAQKHVKAKWGKTKSENSGMNIPSGDNESPLPADEMGLDRKYLETTAGNARKVEEFRRLLGQLELKRSQTTDPKQRAVIEQQMTQLRLNGSMLLIHLGWSNRVRHNYSDARRYLEEAILWGAAPFAALVELGQSYSEDGRCSEAVPFFIKAIQVYPNSVLALMNLGRCYSKLGAKELAKNIFLKVNSLDTAFFRVNREIGVWLLENGYLAQAEKVLLTATEENPRDYFLYEKLAELYTQTGQNQLAQKYQSQAAELEDKAEKYLPATQSNYRQMVELVRNSGVKFVSMQYPLRRDAPLKTVLKGEDGVYFIENKNNFDSAIQSEEFTEYFSDSFAGDFGHCTPKGNRLIAENVADSILKVILPGSNH